MRTPSSVLAGLLADDPTRPRLTYYDDTPGPTQGERIELSAKVIDNWVAKAANALQDEFDVGPGGTVALGLPLAHWRSAYWALATWAVGATVQVGTTTPHDVLVTDDADASTEGDLVVVTLAGLARSHPGPLPSGVMDEARELATYADRFTPMDEAPPTQAAWVCGGEHTAYDAVVRERDWPQGARVNLDGSSDDVLLDLLSAWAVGGSAVLVRSPDAALLPARLESEGVTVDLTA